MREGMFDASTAGRNLLNTACNIYQKIGALADVMRTSEPLRFGRIYLRQISGDSRNFGLPYGSEYTLAFSRLLYANEALVAYNVSDKPRSDSVIVDSTLHQPGSTMTYFFGGTGTVAVQSAPNGSSFVQLPLASHQFVILA